MKCISIFCFLMFLVPGLMFANQSASGLSKTNTASLVNQTSTTNDQKNAYSIQLSYPEFVGKPLSQAQQAINQRIKMFIQQQSQDFIASNIKNNKTAPQDQDANNNKTNLLKIDNTVTQASGKILSIRFSVMTAFWYAAHPSTKYTSFNFDATTGKPITLGSLFKPGANYLQSIVAIVRPKLFKQLYPDVKTPDPKNFDTVLLNQGTTATASNYTVWNIQNDQLMITFQPYQVAAYFYGAPTVLIPLQRISGFTN